MTEKEATEVFSILPLVPVPTPSSEVERLALKVAELRYQLAVQSEAHTKHVAKLIADHVAVQLELDKLNKKFLDKRSALHRANSEGAQLLTALRNLVLAARAGNHVFGTVVEQTAFDKALREAGEVVRIIDVPF